MSANEPISTQPVNPPAAQPQYLSPREAHRAARAERRAARYASGGGWVGGVILILLGGIFLLENLGLPMIGNWWALFVLLPAVATLGSAWNRYIDDGGVISSAVISPAVVGLGFLVLTAILFVGLDLNLIWPVGLILIGIGVLAGALLRPADA